MKHVIQAHKTKMIVAGLVVVLLVSLAAGYVQYRLSQPFMTAEKIAAVRAEVAAQNEGVLSIPSPLAVFSPASSGDRNVYFGDLHVHSSLSFDSYIFGNRWGLEDAYRFARGAAMKNPGGEIMQLTQPLDFVAITDHAEGFAFPSLCSQPASKLSDTENDFCKALENPSASLFLRLRESGERRPMKRIDTGNEAQQIEYEDDTWAYVVAMADKHNEPGKFTTFPAYEYSPPLPKSGKHHRNVIFKNGNVPKHAISGYDAAEAPDLWRGLHQRCQAPCEVLTIPHNPNKTWGLAFSGVTIDGRAYTPEDWALREKMEPLVEMFQIKGASECAYGINSTDEECGFEQFLPRCQSSDEILCIQPTAMARDGLKQGLLLQRDLGFNPLDFGMIGSTDTHNANAGDAEEWDYRGAAANFSTPARTRLLGGRADRGRRALERNPGGLAAVWAEENSREAIFAAMQRKEVYATSGTRIALRFFGGFNDMQPALKSTNPVRVADRLGVPMGAHMPAGQTSKPQFFVWAMRDPSATALDKVQMVKSWVEGDTTRELVFDIACAEGRVPDAEGRCPTLRADIDMVSCAPEAGRGANELKTIWQDDGYQPDEKAFYYIRVLQVESCRWSMFDAIRSGLSHPEGMPRRTAERAWSSPIFVGGTKH